jgi:hypothetical protein
MPLKLSLTFSVVLLSACISIPSPEARQAIANELALAQGWHAVAIGAGTIQLWAYAPGTIKAAPALTLYLEGDGYAWENRVTPSQDPTPIQPVALRLALAHPTGNAAYLARPCQYVNAPAQPCAPRYWMGARFAPEVIEATSLAIDDLKGRFGASQLTLVGYSGGAAVAALVAAQRHDVQQLVSVAGNIDHAAWTTLHRLTPLSESLNPLQARATLGAISQWHFSGNLDRVVPPRLIKSWVQGLPNAHLVVIDGYDHTCCWAENWPQLWTSIQ